MQTESIKRSESASSSNDPRTYLLSSMGLGVMWGWTYLYCLLFATGSRESDLLPSALALGWKIATIAILGISVFWKPPTNKHERELRTSAVTSSMIGGSAVVLWYVGKTTLCIPIEACAAVLFGLSYGMFLRAWPLAVPCRSFSLLLFNLGCSCVIAGSIYLLFSHSSGWLRLCFLTILPACAWVLLIAFRLDNADPSEPGATRRTALFVEPRTLCIAVVPISLSLGFSCQAFAAGPSPDIWTYSSILAGFLLCACSQRNLGQRKLRLLIFGALCLICACTIAAFFLERSLAIALVRVGSFVAMSLALALPAYAAQEAGGPIQQWVCAGFLCYVAPLALGETIWLIWRADTSTFIIIACSLLSIAANILFLKESASSEIQISAENDPGKDSFEERAAALAFQASLTNREREILLPLAKGYSLKTIASMQHVSYNTVKVQVRSIYGKLGIHAREDLVEMLDSDSDSDSDSGGGN